MRAPRIVRLLLLTRCAPPVRGFLSCPQLLLSAKQQLETVVHQKLEEAVAARDHAAVLRFVLLHQPLAVPDQGISRCGSSS